MSGTVEWQIATVKAIKPETHTVKSFTLRLPNWTPHRAGQHYDIRLTAEDGYQAQRSYSIASAPEDDLLTLTIERLDDEPGFWETYGYHNHGDPWLEQRYQGD